MNKTDYSFYFATDSVLIKDCLDVINSCCLSLTKDDIRENAIESYKECYSYLDFDTITYDKKLSTQFDITYDSWREDNDDYDHIKYFIITNRKTKKQYKVFKDCIVTKEKIIPEQVKLFQEFIVNCELNDVAETLELSKDNEIFMDTF